MLAAPRVEQQVSEYIASQFTVGVSDQLLAIINQNSETINILNNYNRATAKALAEKFGNDPLAIERFKAMNLPTKMGFLTMYFNITDAARRELELRVELNHVSKIVEPAETIRNLNTEELYKLQSNSLSVVNNLEDSIRYLQYDADRLKLEIDPPKDGPDSPPAASAKMELSSDIYYLRMAAARNVAEREQRRKQLLEIQQMIINAIANRYQYMRMHSEVARQAAEKISALEQQHAPARIYARR